MGDPLVSVIVRLAEHGMRVMHLGEISPRHRARQSVFLTVQVAPDRSPTGFHSPDFTDTWIATNKTLTAKAFRPVRCSYLCLAISLQHGQRLSNSQEVAGLHTQASLSALIGVRLCMRPSSA